MSKSIEEKAYGLASDRATGSPVNAYMNGFEDGLKEAFMWRDTREEAPEDGQLKQVMYESELQGGVGYYHATYTDGMWDIEQFVAVKVIGWRPMEIEQQYPSPQCDESCFYHCTKGGQQEPDCVNPCLKHYELFELMQREHGLTLLETQMDDIISVVKKIICKY